MKMLDTLTIAKICHEVNRAYCQSINDDSQVSWDKCPDWQKSSAVKGVEFHKANPNATPEDSHKSWLAEKYSNGWVYGMEKDEVEKTHPCMVPYEYLHPEQQAKDALFMAVIEASIVR